MFAAQIKSAAVRVSSCGTAGTPSLYSGSTSRFCRGVSFSCVVGVMNGMKYLSMPGKNSWWVRRNTAPVMPSIGAK